MRVPRRQVGARHYPECPNGSPDLERFPVSGAERMAARHHLTDPSPSRAGVLLELAGSTERAIAVLAVVTAERLHGAAGLARIMARQVEP
jgi:hypothetical protein